MLELCHTQISEICKKHDVLAAYLFGSQVDGTDDQFSDVDIGIVSVAARMDADSIISLQDQLQQLVDDKQLDLVLLRTAAVEVAYDVIRTGQVIYCLDDDARTDFEDICLRDYLDYIPFLRKFYRDMKESTIDGDG